jgi:FixJ family two-component response regulator
MGLGASTTALVFVVDDDRSVRQAISRLIRSVDLQVQSFASAKEFLRAERPGLPSCLVLDVRLRDQSGLELQQLLADHNDDIPIIFITGHGDIPMSVRAMKLGALEFLVKPFRDQDLLEAIQRALERDRAARQQHTEIKAVRGLCDLLTPREHEVFALVVRGLLNKQIAVELGASEKTIKAHRGRVMAKMKAGSLADLVRKADKLGIIPSGAVVTAKAGP